MLAGLSGMEQWSLGDGRGLMNSRRTVALSSIMVTSTAGLSRFDAGTINEDGLEEGGGGDFLERVRWCAPEDLPDRLCHLFVIGRLVEAFGFEMMRVDVMSG
jgi:hypothetical protein